MLFKSVAFLNEQLSSYLLTFPTSDVPNVTTPYTEVANIAGMEEGDINNADKLYITLININEDTTLKNTPHYVKDYPNTIYKNPPIYLNLFILFTACFKKYDHSLLLLSRTIRFFQAKNTFTHKNSITQVKDMEEFNFVLDLYSPSFEQVNYIWSTLGGKQRPFVLYKLRMVEMMRSSIDETRGIIKTITVNEDTNFKL